MDPRRGLHIRLITAWVTPPITEPLQQVSEVALSVQCLLPGRMGRSG